MGDMSAARRAMVNGQIRVEGVTDARVLDAIEAIPRERFAPPAQHAVVYADVETSAAPGRWLLRPRDFAKLLQALGVKPRDVVLDIAGGRGYAAAVLAQMAETVIALEDDTALVTAASESLSEVGANNAVAVQGVLAAGAPDHGPFDVIFVNGAVEEVPDAWLAQLADGGRLGVVIRQGVSGAAHVFQRSGDGFGERRLFDSAAPLLEGFARPSAFAF